MRSALVALERERKKEADPGTEDHEAAHEIRFDKNAADADQCGKERSKAFDAAVQYVPKEGRKIVPSERG